MDPIIQLERSISQDANVELRPPTYDEVLVKGEDKSASGDDASKERKDSQNVQVVDVEMHKNEENEGKVEAAGDDAEEEKKSVEKPLLDDKETVSIDLGRDEIHFQGDDTPTLPLPEKKKSLPDIDVEAIKESKNPPSTFRFPISRLRYEWKNAKSMPEFFGRAICIIFVTLGWAFFVGGLPFISVVMLIMGSIYIDDCPSEPRIPTYLIVAGFFGTLQLLCKIIKKLVPERFQDLVEAQKRRCLLVEGIMEIFLFIWFILGCVWVYTKFEPEYDNPEHEKYCNKTVYLFTYWIFNLTFLMLCFLLIFSFCIILIVASSSKD